MSDQRLYDLSPIFSLLVLGALLAALPAAWVWLRHRRSSAPKRQLALTLLTLFLTFDLILVGAFTRLTDSGLGCPDWPGCYGRATPLGASSQIQAAQDAMPTGPVTHQKAWIEMVHRYMASAVGALIMVMAWMAWRNRQRADTTTDRPSEGVSPPHILWTLVTLIWVCLQGAFGALTVTMKLFPAIVTLHLLGAYALLALLVVQAVGWHRVVHATAFTNTTWPQRVGNQGDLLWVRRALVAALLLLLIQASSGAWVSTNYAVLACTEFPKCQGQWWPSMDFAVALEFWRPLGERADGSAITFQALTAIHVLHRLLAMLTLAVLTWLAWRLRHVDALKSAQRLLLVLLLLQLLTGLSNVVLDWPMLAAILHTGGAGALVGVLVWMLTLLHHAQSAVGVAGQHAHKQAPLGGTLA